MFTTLSNLLVLGLAATSHAARIPSKSSKSTWRGSGKSAGSPAYNYMYQKPLPIPSIAVPDFEETVDGRTVQFYSTTIEPFTAQVYPNLGPVHLTGYNGVSPGPTFRIKKGKHTIPTM